VLAAAGTVHITQLDSDVTSAAAAATEVRIPGRTPNRRAPVQSLFIPFLFLFVALLPKVRRLPGAVSGLDPGTAGYPDSS
jgi:hypothetical protein